MEKKSLKIDLTKFPRSKSIQIRLLVLKSYDPEISVTPLSLADDVQFSSQAFTGVLKGQLKFFIGASATAFRFLCLRLSRLVGEFSIETDETLKNRPHQEMMDLLFQLGVKNMRWQANNFCFQSMGWPKKDLQIKIDTLKSSQLLSALFLNVWGFSHKIEVKTDEKLVSQPYWNLSKDILKKYDLPIDENLQLQNIPKHPGSLQLSSDVDWSSLAAILSFYCLKGEASLSPFTEQFSQADRCSLEFFQQMGAKIQIENQELNIQSASELKGVNVNLEMSPDLFPVLAVLASLATTPSRFTGLQNLALKESNRLEKISELFQLLKIEHKKNNDSLDIIKTFDPEKISMEKLEFDCSSDHRLVMAAALYVYLGVPLNIIGSKSLKKSFPDYFQFAPVSQECFL